MLAVVAEGCCVFRGLQRAAGGVGREISYKERKAFRVGYRLGGGFGDKMKIADRSCRIFLIDFGGKFLFG